jgi:hypothetical protein
MRMICTHLENEKMNGNVHSYLMLTIVSACAVITILHIQKLRPAKVR